MERDEEGKRCIAAIGDNLQTLTLTETEPPTSTNIPPDVMQEILSRLPISSVFQSRCVSPNWRSLIKDPRFSKMHYNHSIKNPTPTNLIILDLEIAVCWGGDLCYVPNLDTCEQAIKLNSMEKTRWKMVGSVNGFICLKKQYEEFIICNPVTGHSINLPTGCLSSNYYGFGWNRRNNEYKLIRMYTSYDPLENNRSWLEVNVCTLGSSNVWRSIGTVPINISWLEESGVFLNGCLHWFVVDGSLENNVVHGIRAVNVEKETLGGVPVPYNMEGKINHRFLQLGVLRGCLMIADYSEDSVQVWLMKNYGVEESWSLEFVIPNHTMYEYLKPLGVLKNGNILLACSNDYRYYNELVTYNPNNRTHEFLRVNGLPENFQAYLHMGTLLPVKDVIAME